jgi:hypothetical protein
MKKINLLGYASITGIFLMMGTSANAWFDSSRSSSSSTSGRAAGCAPATALTNIELNNVRALVENGGSLWQDRANSRGAYYVPKTPDGSAGPSAIYSGALWMGGTDVNNQLKLAAILFRQGNDFWPGPLTTDGSAEVDANTCLEYDEFFHITRAEVQQYVSYCKCVLSTDCDEAVEYAGYSVPNSIMDWPAHGDVSLSQDFYLAPFYDGDGDGVYNPDPLTLDYPWYDIEGDVECNATDRKVLLFGDDTFWWIFNDKGNVHTETGGDPIGMEIRAQAFAFATNDEVNNMTFYNYELINRSTQTLQNTYFGQYADADLGCSEDDYVGCDVRRGLGYCYNADAVDDDGCNGAIPYGANPPAIGIDFFEGPYKDNDGIDNPGPTSANGNFITYNQATAGDGIVYKGMGIGYGDGKVDNERFGMRKFLYWSRQSPNAATTDPSNATHFYNYLRGYWKDASRMIYGGTGHVSDASADPNTPADYMFPGDSDPQGFGTNGAPQSTWSEVSDGNQKGDRRLLQSAGPFTLQPGARNNITVGVVWARATGGGIEAPVDAVRLADDKAQALFDNCFEILEGPDAPDVRIQELENELILYIENSSGNNVGEDFVKEDPFIITPDSLLQQGIEYDNEYRFQGYQIYQLADESVGPQELYDVDKARLIAQVDLKDGVGRLINWELDESIGVIVPQMMVDGEDEGVRHSFRITEDEFATSNRRLVNHKKYYFMAIAYSHNEYAPFDPTDPQLLNGQKKPYLGSRKNGQGQAIQVYVGIPHHPAPEAFGTIQNSTYGDGPKVTRVEGRGNGGLVLDLTPETEARIVANYVDAYPEYQNGKGPIDVRVVDPLNVISGNFELRFVRGSSDLMSGINLLGLSNIAEATWVLTHVESGQTISSDEAITVGNEQLIPEWGIAITIEQPVYTQPIPNFDFTEPLEATIEFADSSKRWLGGVSDGEGFSDNNWIMAGTQTEEDVDTAGVCPYPSAKNDYGTDEFEVYENLIDGTWAPFSLCDVQTRCVDHMPIGKDYGDVRSNYDFSDLQSVDIVFTSDKSKWTRSPVIEMSDYQALAQGGVKKMELRSAPSVDQNGNPDGTGTGMGWFPGYAIDVETGERLNIAFAEDSWLAVDNGRDMLWNPTSTMYTSLGDPVWGGKHYVYVFKNEVKTLGAGRMPAYDGGVYIENQLKNTSISQRKTVWRSCMWVGMPVLEEEQELLSTDVKIRLRVKKAYARYATNGTSMLNSGQDTLLSDNTWFPLYTFKTTDIATSTGTFIENDSTLDMINVVPNPYYAFSAYETGRLDNRVKFTNLPEQCTVTIYTVNGTLVRQYSKDDALTSLDWDLKNFKGIPIAGGTYIIHVDVPGVGERILKWFGAVRPPDLDNF